MPYQLKDTIPQRESFVDNGYGGDGKTHDVRMAAELSTIELTRLQQWGKDLESAEGIDQAILVDQRLGEYIQMIIPSLPADRISLIPPTVKADIIKWWNDSQPTGKKVTPPTK